MAFRMKKTIDAEKGTVTFQALGNEDAVLFEEIVELARLTEANQRHAPLHGISQKVGDSYAGAGGDDVADPLEFTRQAIVDTREQLYTGEWKSAGVGGPRVSDLAQAISQLNGEPIEKVVEDLKGATDEQRKKLRKKPAIAAKIAAIAAQKAVERANRLAEAAAKAEEPKAA